MSDVVIPSSEADRQKIKDAIEEMSNSFVRVEAEREHQKAIVERIFEDMNFDKRIFKKMAKDYHKNKFDQTVSENDAYETAYELIIKG
jgi:ectoine hydroxylase-related dioxygenase (phytanoyl-CoA dioxygenase family)